MTPRRLARMAVPLLIVGSILMMVIPVPPALLDLFLATNITLGILILMSVLLLKDSLDFSVFPSLLLVMTMLRLALNVSSTRLILLDGYAGKVIETFGNFVIGGSVIVGLVVFLILIIIQFAVVTSGAGRVAEVAARFTLDAMPGKQMAIDADLAAGLIDEHQAKDKRERIAKEAEFYGAMDGASKFVKGDAMAGVVIVLINLLGGFGIGIMTKGLSFAESMQTYSLLTVGDGLVSQIPALFLSIATGLLVTRVRSDKDLGPELGRQIFGNPRALRTGAVITGGLMLLPGLPKLPFLALASGLYFLSTRQPIDEEEAEEEAARTAVAVEANPDDPEALVGQMRVEPLELHLSYDILDLIDPARGGDLLERVRALRQQIAMELGVVMPFVRTRDDVSLPQHTYRILLHGVEVARGAAPLDRALALPAGDGSELASLRGEETVEPVFGLKAFWIALEDRATAAASGATVVDRSSVIVTHLAEVVRTNAPDLLSRNHVFLLLEGLRAEEPQLAGEVGGGDGLTVGLFQQVLRKLLEERVAIRDLGRIVEAVAARVGEIRSPELLANVARVALGGAIVAKVAPEGRLGALTLDAAEEAAMHEALRDVDGVIHLALDPERIGRLHTDISAAMSRTPDPHLPVALVCGQMLRRPLARTLQGIGLDIPVLAYPELPPHVQVVPIGVIGNVQIGA
jgi:flagellar biosynthesis protein FlhA